MCLGVQQKERHFFRLTEDYDLTKYELSRFYCVTKIGIITSGEELSQKTEDRKVNLIAKYEF